MDVLSCSSVFVLFTIYFTYQILFTFEAGSTRYLTGRGQNTTRTTGCAGSSGDRTPLQTTFKFLRYIPYSIA